ncbi:hypothetical protein H1Z61_02910 [Bacillus aquiflavi]|uniref:YpoC-like domain-containing protein n=1 Tax=Bacillus aquiflavi TaxID=2672567 RepID=A0A6B3VY51_9BACI|nr:hypothetical protein [Bacillus aquiflavi]MBA4536117.1 hypothetical protein [Bacillus aquiflavi]NEY80491.1 hypothetical protein [Bacillus aquiflavi]UAC47042.1 hypothetical protein K6959_09715 [Bacillus aquiflavi]
MEQKNKIIPVPVQLKNSFFFPDDKIETKIAAVKNHSQIILNELFSYEVAYYSGVKGNRPWETPEAVIPQLLTEWKQLKKTLIDIFERRDRRQALKPMKRGIALFVQFLFWVHHLPVNLQSYYFKEDLFVWKPVNFKERLDFIFARPNDYHSFVQLSELMIELEKQYFKKEALKK